MFETARPETFKPHSQQNQQAPVEEHVALDRLLFQRRETKRSILAAQGGLPGDGERRAGRPHVDHPNSTLTYQEEDPLHDAATAQVPHRVQL
eukprot:9593530-Heterocapsa_arctica.AAC.1